MNAAALTLDQQTALIWLALLTLGLLVGAWSCGSGRGR